MRLALASLTLLAAAAPAADRGRVPAAIPAGKPVRCLPINSIRESQVRSGRVIDFVMRDGRVFRNELASSCPGLGFERRFIYATSLTQLCSTDVITVLLLNPVQRGASCGLGQFQPVTLTSVARRRR